MAPGEEPAPRNGPDTFQPWGTGAERSLGLGLKPHSQERIKIAGKALPGRIDCVECVTPHGMFDADNCSCLCSSKRMETLLQPCSLPNFHFPLFFFWIQRKVPDLPAAACIPGCGSRSRICSPALLPGDFGNLP